MKNFLLFILLTAATFTGFGQFRSMIDAPSVYLTSRDVLHIPSDDGLGLDFGYAIGTHFMMVKISGGVMATTDFSNKEIFKSTIINPFGRLELGVGKWRSNGQRCAKTNQNAFTAMAKGGLIYNFGKKTADVELGIPGKSPFLDYYVGIELSQFYIKDYRKNSEYFLSGGWNLKSETLFAELGIRTFFNTMESR